MPLTVVITGAAGHIGRKLRAHLAARGEYALRLIDREPRGDPEILAADLGTYDARWVRAFDGADAVVHLAANPEPLASWSELVGPNVDAPLNVFLAAAQHGVKRVVLASSVWAMASRIGTEGPVLADEPEPGANAYGATKLFAERIAKSFARTHGLSAVVLRVGHSRRDPIEPGPPMGTWEDAIWISNADLCQGLERAIRAEVSGCVVVNLTSANPGSPWSLAEARRWLGYEPHDGRALDAPATAAGTRDHRRPLLARLRSSRVAGR